MFTLIILSPSRSSILLVNDMWIFAFLLHPTYHSWLLLWSNFQFPSDDHFLYNFILHIFSISLEGSNYRESTVFKKVKGRGGRGIFYQEGAAYWGQGCFLNMSTYQTCTWYTCITKKNTLHLHVRSCLISCLLNYCNMKSKWQQSGPDTMYLAVV